LLGAILEQKFGLSEAKLLEALNIQQTKGGRLGEALIKIRAIEEDLAFPPRRQASRSRTYQKGADSFCAPLSGAASQSG
jgi:hypothetical protein